MRGSGRWGYLALRLSPGLWPHLQAARFALDQAAWMLCFVSPALAGSSFTYAEHPGTPIPVIWYSSLSSKYQVDTFEQQGGGTCQSEVKKDELLGSDTNLAKPQVHATALSAVPCGSAEGWANLAKPQVQGSDPKNSRTAACATARLRSHPLHRLRPAHTPGA